MQKDGFPLDMIIDEQVNSILIHKESHFGGYFSEMIDYYVKEGKGVKQEFDLSTIKRLSEIEKKSGINICDHILSDSEKREIKRAKRAYIVLKKSYQGVNSNEASLISDLLLSEETEPEKEIQAIVSNGTAMVPALLRLFDSDDFYLSSFPGYGFGPELAAKCLGQVGDPRAIVPLFCRISRVDFFTEDAILEALKKIGRPSELFLLKLLKSKPFSEDNEKAALALVHFKNSHEVAKTALRLLQCKDFLDKPTYLNYLAIIAEGLKGTSLEQEFYCLAQEDSLPEIVREDIRQLSSSWNVT